MISIPLLFVCYVSPFRRSFVVFRLSPFLPHARSFLFFENVPLLRKSYIFLPLLYDCCISLIFGMGMGTSAFFLSVTCHELGILSSAGLKR
jgi:hypothetical protein